MHSGLTEDFNRSSPPHVATSPDNNRQHGPHEHGDPPPGPSHRTHAGCEEYGPSASADGTTYSALGVPERPLSRPISSSASHDEGCDKEPEQRHKGRKRGQPVRQVARSKDRMLNSIGVADLPNEILTHILSYLPADSLISAALVSQRFHQLVTTPHAWRSAFLRYFPGSAGVDSQTRSGPGVDSIGQGQRAFTRLTALASWRSEYILRTRLLRALARGKPPRTSQSSGSGGSNKRHTSAISTFDSQLPDIVDRLHGNFGNGVDQRRPKFRFGTTLEGRVGSSDPTGNVADAWGSEDMRIPLRFDRDFLNADPPFGLGAGQLVGNPNPMDVSQLYGTILGEGLPGGRIYFHHSQEKTSRCINFDLPFASRPEYGVPSIAPERETVCSVWIAKSNIFPSMTNGLLGMLSGSSSGILTAYSVGTNGLDGRRMNRGEITAKWALSPGVPLINIQLDDCYNTRRFGHRRVFAVVLNALGEVFYLCDLFKRPKRPLAANPSDDEIDKLAWETGRSVHWNVISTTVRSPLESDEIERPMPSFSKSELSASQLEDETRRIETLARKNPRDFREMCDGWDMQRRLEVDFAGDDERGAGESVLLFDCGLRDVDGPPLGATRFTRSKDLESDSPDSPALSAIGNSSHRSVSGDSTPRVFEELQADAKQDQWMRSNYSFAGLEPSEVTVSAVDLSTFALLTVEEDPLLSLSTSSASSPWSSPGGPMPRPASAAEVPGHRARLVAAGTNHGSIVLWDLRAPLPPSPELVNTISPLRIIRTDSPRINCLALTALFLMHGGTDGLVQAWDPLASDTKPLRTLNSRYSIRSRRRLVIADAPPGTTGNDFFRAGAISLDPDPTILRGMMSLGPLLRYWSYSADAAEQYKRSKRRWRRSHRGSNHSPQATFTPSRHATLKGYIADEQAELERERRADRQEQARLADRFGIGLLGPGATEAEILAYATLLSHESAAEQTTAPSDDRTPSAAVAVPTVSTPRSVALADTDLDEAIRRSLQDSESSSSPEAFPIRYVRSRRRSPPSVSSPRSRPVGAGPSDAVSMSSSYSHEAEAEDLEFALQLSLAEEESRAEAQAADATVDDLEGSRDEKGKGKQRMA